MLKKLGVLLVTLTMLMGLCIAVSADETKLDSSGKPGPPSVASPAPAGTTEIQYDDGTAENGWAGNHSDFGIIFAVCFTNPCRSAVKLLKARVYVFDVEPSEPFLLWVFSQASKTDPPGNVLVGPIEWQPTVDGWNEVDLSGYNLQFGAGEHFAIGVIQKFFNPYNWLGEDQNDPDMRSWWYNNQDGWQLWFEVNGYYADWMIRAVVEYEGSCCAEVVTADEGVLNSLRGLRDEVLANSAIGQSLIDMYYNNSPEIVGILVRNPTLSIRSAAVLTRLMPGITYLLDQDKGRDIKITPQLVARINKLLKDIGGNGSNELSATLSELSEMVKACEGMQISEIAQAMED
jgi:opacity protein-like surface antigen